MLLLFLKLKKTACTLTDAPSKISSRKLQELGIKISILLEE